jgi:peptidoglycan/LPS O-acetylase OafA/YrhL
LLTLPVSLFLMSYPPSLPETASWSAALTDLLPHLPETPEPFRLLPSIGAFLLVSGVITSPGAKRALATPAAARLGRASFAIYLLHGMVLRSVFAWVLFWGAELEDVDIEDPTGRRDWVVASRYAVPGAGRCVVAVAVAVLVLAGAVLVWVRWVERWCGAVAGMVEGWMADGGEGIRRDAAF